MVVALVLIALAFCTPFTIEKIMVNNTKKNAYLTKGNENRWMGIPGDNDIGIYWN